jgi:MarR family transcriptional regulator, 2-MHQ and catechol-resistance regulon repressor
VPEDRRDFFYQCFLKEEGPGYAGFDLASSQVVLDMAATYEMLHQIVARYMTEFGLSKSTYNILMLLRHCPEEGMQLHDLGDLLLVSRANITGLIDHLEQKGFVRRFTDETDRRARWARITPEAKKLLDEFVPIHFKNTKALLKDLSEKEKETLSMLLRKARRSLADNADAAMRDEITKRD